MQTAKEAIAWIKSLKPFGYKPGTERMEWMLAELGHPERRLKFVHIAGTNGKGSNVAFISSVLRACNYDVGTYISPHITTYLSRISYNGKEIEEVPLVEICNRLKKLSDQLAESELGTPTEFEILTMTAILYFANYTFPDIVVWETGMGGRYDSTNVVHPLVSVITNVSFDHMHILGDTIEKIAAEKAGIIKSGVPVVTAVEDEAAFQVIQEKAASLRTKVYRLGKDFHISGEHMDEEQQYFTFHGPFVQYKDVQIGLRGYHQFKNAATSLMTLEILRQYFAFNVDEEGLYTGFREAINPGRLEVISEGPFIVLDGAHNAHGAKAISSSIPHLFNYDQLILVVSIMQDKLMDEMLDHLLPLTNQIVITRARNPRAVDPAILSEKVRNKQPELPIYIEQEPIDAVKRAVALAGPKDLVLVTGSLYLIESIRDNLSYVIEKKVGEKW